MSNGLVAHTLDYYLGLVIPEHRDKPRFMAMLTTMIQPLVDLQVILASMPRLFDLDAAAGVQLDSVGLWIGVTRFVRDIPFTGGTLTRLEDAHYRILLKAKIISNRWDGTTPNAYAFFAQLFAGTGLTVQIVDHDDMSMTAILIGSTDPVLSGLFVAGLLFVKPSGVHVDYVIG